ncbi:MAG TPA: transglutaminase family protein [Candidatus Bathyarchaeia archaeon]|nr:transglutaminase family protein [Candidatus Bathyarchaeia archaeon]
MNRYHLLHVTEFVYDGPVSESYNEVRLRPMHDDNQSCLSFRLTTQPASPAFSYRDALGNWVHQVNILPVHTKLKVHAESVVLTHDITTTTSWMTLAELDQQRDQLVEDFYDMLAPSKYVPHLPELEPLIALAESRSDGTVAGFVQSAASMIHGRFKYVKGATHVNSSIADSLKLGAGVCQDFAHLLLGVLRKRGIPARYVSGYLVPQNKDNPNAKQEEVIGGQASHAWTEAYLPDSEWMPLDPTLGKPVGMRHVRIAYGRDYADVAPVRGVYKGHAGQRLSVDVSVRPALDDAGHETLSETAAFPAEPERIEPLAQQPGQQQQ